MRGNANFSSEVQGYSHVNIVSFESNTESNKDIPRVAVPEPLVEEVK